MTKLQRIQKGIQQIAETPTDALCIGTEIIEEELNIIAGTGKHEKRIVLQKDEREREEKTTGIYCPSFRFEDILGQSCEVKEAIKQASMIAQNSSTVLITGESGTGKELFARAIHYASKRKNDPFITVNCGAIPENLMESEMFGYDGGAFTGAIKTGKIGKFELANKGTIFLDEIGDLSLSLQVKLLHVLQRREIERVGGNRVIPIDVRVIAATNRDLTKMMCAGEFRQDLYFRLCVIPLQIPALRERDGDIELLLQSFLKKFSKSMGKEIFDFQEEALALLQNYDWPGNVRELENAIEYAVNFESGPIISVKSILPRIRQAALREKKESSLKFLTDEFQKRLIEKCLQTTGLSVEGKKKAAELLEISESTLYRRIKELHIGNDKEK